jgi:hypothetical protein
VGTDDIFDFVAVLFEQFEREKTHCYNSLALDDYSAVHLGEGTFS